MSEEPSSVATKRLSEEEEGDGGCKKAKPDEKTENEKGGETKVIQVHHLAITEEGIENLLCWQVRVPEGFVPACVIGGTVNAVSPPGEFEDEPEDPTDVLSINFLRAGHKATENENEAARALVRKLAKRTPSAKALCNVESTRLCRVKAVFATSRHTTNKRGGHAKLKDEIIAEVQAMPLEDLVKVTEDFYEISCHFYPDQATPVETPVTPDVIVNFTSVMVLY
jgi:hypothetical protein